MNLDSNIPKYNYTFPLGLGYISSVMKKAGYNVTGLNLNHKDGTIDKILEEELAKGKYDIITTGTIWQGYLAMKEIIESVRKYSPASKIILGGSLVTSDAKTVMKTLKPNFGVIGEGEVTILELLEGIEKTKSENLFPFYSINGICYLVNGAFIKTKPREPIEDIDSIPYTDYDSFGFEKYLDEMYPNQHYANNLFDYPRAYSILGSRGCPFHCTFCYHSLGRYRERSIDNVIEELGWAIKKYKINVINFIDDSFGIKKERLYELCDKIKGLISTFPWDIKWTCQIVVSCVDEESLKKLKESGCHIISYGFESYNQEVLKSMKKPITPEQIDFAIKATLKAGLSIQGNFIFGDIAETKKTAKETLEYWKENCSGQVNLSFVQPYAGSEFYNYCIRKGIIEDEVLYMSKDIKCEVIINATDKMNMIDFNSLCFEILRLRRSGYYKVSIPKLVSRMEGKTDRCLVIVECPFCHKDITYKNYYMIEDKFYKDYIICRDCHLRFYMIRPTII